MVEKKVGRMREPEIGEASDELKPLIMKGLDRGKALGHQMIVWRREFNSAELRCQVCERIMGVAIHPAAGNDQVCGQAARETCR